MNRLTVTDHHGKQQTFDLEPGARLLIGRAEKNDVVLTDPSLSREHAEVYEQQGAWLVNDRNSRNGTFVSGRRIAAPVPLEPGLRVTLGTCALWVDQPASASANRSVIFADKPLDVSGTVMMSAADALRAPSGQARDEKTFNQELEKIRKRFGIVEKANTHLLAHESMDLLLPKILDLVHEAVQPERSALLRRDKDGSLVCDAFRGRDREEWQISRTIANAVIDQRVSVMTADAQADFGKGESVVVQGIQAVMAVPLWNDEEVIGLIYTDSRLTSTLFDQEDLRLLSMLANIAAIQIQNAGLFAEQLEKQRFEREAKAAADIQARLLPRNLPDIPGYKFIGRNKPCYECGGDYYDLLELGSKRTAVVLADVAGKGMGAAMLMAVIQATLRARCDMAPGPEDLVERLTNAIANSAPSNRYATLFLLDIDREAHSVRSVNAGHAPLPLLVRASGELHDFESGGVPLGMFPGITYPVPAITLEVGDFVFACSDGVTDLENPSQEMFGEERLRDLLATLAGKSADEIRTTVDQQLESHAHDRRQPDDLTYVILQRVD